MYTQYTYIYTYRHEAYTYTRTYTDESTHIGIFAYMHTFSIVDAEVQSLDCTETSLLLSCGELRPSELLLAALAKAGRQRAATNCL